MTDIKKRREEILQQLRTDAGREAVIRRLKQLMGLRPEDKLPNGTPIISTLIKLEDGIRHKQATHQAASRS